MVFEIGCGINEPTLLGLRVHDRQTRDVQRRATPFPRIQTVGSIAARLRVAAVLGNAQYQNVRGLRVGEGIEEKKKGFL